MRTVYGRVCDGLGHARRQTLEHGGLGPVVHTTGWATAGGEVRDVQSSEIPIDYGHDGRVLGRVVHLERDRRDGLWAVGELTADVEPAVAVRVGTELRSVPVELYWSALASATDDGRDVEILALSITTSPAQVNARPLTFLDGALDYPQVARERWQLRSGSYDHGLLDRAALSARERRAGHPIRVWDEQTAINAARTEHRHIDRVGAIQFQTDKFYDDVDRRRIQRAAVRGSVLRVR